MANPAGEREATPRIKIRIESLSDMVFGLALSIGSLILIGNRVSTPFELLSNVLFFGFSFLIIVMTWLGYSRTIAMLPAEVPSALFLNLALLFCVAIEPYLYYVLLYPDVSRTFADYSSAAYGVDVGLMFIILATLARLLLKENEQRQHSPEAGHAAGLHPVIVQRFRRVMTAEYVIGALFLVSCLPIFWIATPIGEPRFFFWYSSLAIFFAVRVPRRQRSAASG